MIVLGVLLTLSMAVAVVATCLYLHQWQKQRSTNHTQSGANPHSEESVGEKYYEDVGNTSVPMMKDNESYGKLGKVTMSDSTL